jgi:hypothetical protein
MVFEPAVDMFLLEQAHLFVGNMLSTFSTNVAAIRCASSTPERMRERPPQTRSGGAEQPCSATLPSTSSSNREGWLLDRYAAGERESVLSWPQIETDKSFWQCERAHFWCGPPTSEWSSAGKTKAHGTC